MRRPGSVLSRHLGIAVLSAATLLLELSLTRILSIKLWYHFGFLIISTALLGFGAAGVTLSIWPRLRDEASTSRWSLAFAVATVSALVLGIWLPFDPFTLLVDRKQLVLMPLYSLVLAAPFACAGVVIALLLTRHVAEASRLYAADLAGAAAGCVGAVLVLPLLGAPGAVLFAAVLGSVASLALAEPGASTHATWIVGMVTIALTAAGPPVAKKLAQEVYAKRRPGAAVDLSWDSGSMVVELELAPDVKKGFTKRERLFVIDMAASTGVEDLRPDPLTTPREQHDPLELAVGARTSPSVLVIGSGAGSQVWSAVRAGARRVDAIEINPVIAERVRENRDDFWGGLFRRPEVRLHADEGRSFLRRSTERYDVIIAVHTISNAAVAAGALGLAESYVLTAEAFDDYITHLTDDGVLLFTRPSGQIPRLVATAREALARAGIQDAARHVFAYCAEERADFAQSGWCFGAGMIVQKRAFEPADLVRIRASLAELETGLEQAHVEEQYAPDRPGTSPVLQEILTTPDLPRLYASHKDQLEPATDDRPFFNAHARWSNLSLADVTALLRVEKGTSASIDKRRIMEEKPLAELALVALILQSSLIAAGFVLVPLLFGARSAISVSVAAPSLFYFAALGFGFMVTEMALLQRFGLYLGRPIYSLAVVLSGLLLSTGAGSYFAGRSRLTPPKILARSLPLAVLAILLFAWLVPPLLHATLGLPLPARLAVAVALLFPLGLLLGTAFPTALKIIAERRVSLVPWAWGVNGFFTVLGGGIGLLLAMIAGYSAVLVLGAATYAAAWLISARLAAPVTP